MNDYRRLIVPSFTKRAQQGSVLITSLILLIVLSMVGISAANNAVLAEKVSSNNQFKTVAFQSANSALAKQLDTLSKNPTTLTKRYSEEVLELAASESTEGISIKSELKLIGTTNLKADQELDIYSFGNQAFYAELQVEAHIDGSGARSRQIQGLQIVLAQSH